MTFSIFSNIKTSGRLFFLGSIAACLLTPFSAQATTISTFTGTQNPANGSLTGFTATLTTDTGTAYTSGVAVNLQYQTAGGVAIGAPIPTTTGPGGVVTVPPPPIPAGAAPAGNQVTITDPSGAGSPPGSTGGGGIAPSTTAPLYWYVSGWYSTKNVFKLDPAGLPGGPTQHWFIEDGGSGLPSLTSTYTGLTEQVINSGFDLSYVPLGSDVYEAVITGDSSFIRLQDGTYISFPDSMSFGTIDVAPGAATGSLDFSGMGVSGTWSFDSLHLYTLADVSSSFGSLFTATAISEGASTPEPSTWVFMGAGILLIAGGRWRCAAHKS